ncbi:MAG: hypothetical protein ACKN9T_18660 [Candidatus Methylumidiphilus sp.]
MWTTRPSAATAEPELRRYTAVHVVGNEEVRQYSDEVMANCA